MWNIETPSLVVGFMCWIRMWPSMKISRNWIFSQRQYKYDVGYMYESFEENK